MKVALAILLNMGFLVMLLPWLWRQWQWARVRGWQRALAVGLGLRMVVGIARHLTLKLDAGHMSFLAGSVTQQIWSDPRAAFHTLTDAVVVFPVYSYSGVSLYDAVFQSTSNTWFLVKVLALLNLASTGIGWVNGLYLSVVAFIGCWQMVVKVGEALPKTPVGAAVVAFLLWPTTWFWATGISKEAVLLGSGAWLTARVVGSLYGASAVQQASAWQRASWWLGTAVIALLHFQMRYFFALPLIGVLAAIAFTHSLEKFGLVRRRAMQAVLLIGILSFGVWLVPKMSVAFSANKFTNQVIRVYTHEIAQTSGRPHFEYPNLRPTLASLAEHAPVAIANTITRPWIGESQQPFYVASGLENAGLLSLIVLAVIAFVRGRGGNLPFTLGLGLAVFCVILAILMGLTTPNLGSLSRYRSELLPFLLFLLLQNDYAASLLKRVGLGSEQPR